MYTFNHFLNKHLIDNILFYEERIIFGRFVNINICMYVYSILSVNLNICCSQGRAVGYSGAGQGEVSPLVSVG